MIRFVQTVGISVFVFEQILEMVGKEEKFIWWAKKKNHIAIEHVTNVRNELITNNRDHQQSIVMERSRKVNRISWPQECSICLKDSSGNSVLWT